MAPQPRPARLLKSYSMPVDAAEFAGGCAHSFFERHFLAQVFFNQVRNDLGVCLGDEAVVFLPQSLFELQIVFDDAVMNDDDAAGTIAMRVSVLFGGTTVRGPTRVADTVGAVDGTEPDRFFEVAQFAFGATNLEVVVFVDDRNTG